MKNMIEIKNINPIPVEERAKQVEQLKDKLYTEIGDCRQSILKELSGFFRDCPKGTVEKGIMSDKTYDKYRLLIDRAHALEILEDYVDRPDAFLESYDGAYRARPWEDGSFSLGRDKIYVIPDGMISVWLQEDFPFTRQFLDAYEEAQKTEKGILCDEWLAFSPYGRSVSRKQKEKELEEIEQ
jgi:hypothetical protein